MEIIKLDRRRHNKYHPDSDEEYSHMAININDGKWFKWAGDLKDIFSKKDIEFFPPNTRFEITIG